MNSNLRTVKPLIWILAFLTSMISCKTDNSFDYPLVFTGEVINISETSATFTGKITNLGSNTNFGIRIYLEFIPEK